MMSEMTVPDDNLILKIFSDVSIKNVLIDLEGLFRVGHPFFSKERVVLSVLSVLFRSL